VNSEIRREGARVVKGSVAGEAAPSAVEPNEEAKYKGAKDVPPAVRPRPCAAGPAVPAMLPRPRAAGTTEVAIVPRLRAAGTAGTAIGHASVWPCPPERFRFPAPPNAARSPRQVLTPAAVNECFSDLWYHIWWKSYHVLESFALAVVPLFLVESCGILGGARATVRHRMSAR
jgi:hypothetical protein